jgi:hypothetical protein
MPLGAQAQIASPGQTKPGHMFYLMATWDTLQCLTTYL